MYSVYYQLPDDEEQDYLFICLVPSRRLADDIAANLIAEFGVAVAWVEEN